MIERESDSLLALSMTWSGKKFPIEIPSSHTVGDLKSHIELLTNVLPIRQKLVGLAKGKLPSDDIILESLSLTPNRNFIMMGTAENKIIKDFDAKDLPVVINDLNPDVDDYFPTDVQSSLVENKLKLQRAIRNVRVKPLNPVRKDKKLLILDLDYTLFDCKSSANSIHELIRPGMHEFLSEVYKQYDICIWSQTAWKFLKMKITELGILNNENYKITFVMDITSMFTIINPERLKKGKPMEHQVKALDILWANHEYVFGHKNTIHIDDVSRNFAMNPQSGLKISAFKNAHKLRHTDRELFYLKHYLILIAEKVNDFSVLNHKNWKEYLFQFNVPYVPPISISPEAALDDASLGLFSHVPPPNSDASNSWVTVNNMNNTKRAMQGEYENPFSEEENREQLTALLTSAPKYQNDIIDNDENDNSNMDSVSFEDGIKSIQENEQTDLKVREVIMNSTSVDNSMSEDNTSNTAETFNHQESSS